MFSVSSTTPATHVAALCERQRDFARKPFGTPIKTHLTFELANHIFHNACAEPAVRGRRDGRPTRLDPAQAEASVCSEGPCDFSVTTRTDSDPYFAALVASSCKEMAMV